MFHPYFRFLIGLYLCTINSFAVCDNYDVFEALKLEASEICPSKTFTCGDSFYSTLTGCCGFCDCEMNCIEHGSCCLSEYTSLAHAQITVKTSRHGCVKPQYLRTKEQTDFVSTIDDSAIWMITKCSPAATGEEKELCENVLSHNSVVHLVPVFHNEKLYRNKFCAYCNGVPKSALLSEWRVEIQCREPFVRFPSDEELLKTIEAKKCNIFFKVPDFGYTSLTERCKEQIYSISTCNVTGLWSKYNETIEKACDSFADAFNMTYKNYFCWVCNTNGHLQKDIWECRSPDMGAGGIVNPPFIAILDLSAIRRQEENTEKLICDKVSQFEDEKQMKCRDILCSGQSFLKDETCQSENSSIDDAECNIMFVKFTALDGLIQVEGVNGNEATVNGNEAINELQYTLRALLNDTRLFLDDVKIYKQRASDDASEQKSSYLIFQIRVFIPNDRRSEITSNLIGVLDKTVLSRNRSVVSFESQIVSYDLLLFDDPFKMTIEIPNDDGSSFDVIERVQSFENILVDLNSERCQGYFPFNRINVCPFVKLNKEDLNYQKVNTFLIVNQTPIFRTFHAWEFQIDGSGDVSLCLSDYTSIYDAMPQRMKDSINDDVTTGAKETFSLVCVCLSVMCLLVTIAVYVALPEMHTQPGVNTTVLCTCLLLAQVVYQFGAGQTRLSYWACAVIGGLCHFLWLAVMFAMNVCSFDMFQVFTKFTKMSTDFNRKGLLKRLGYIISFSILFVLINLVISVSLSNGKDIGYGGIICFLSNTRMHLISFIVPSLLTIISNFVLFFYVVMKIGQTRLNAVKLGHERNYFGVYVRLSTLTGLTWLLGFLQLLIKNEVLEYQFILLNAGQGIFIMIAFVCNKRIYRLIEGKISTRINSQTQKTGAD